jgi:hypothetical protein
MLLAPDGIVAQIGARIGNKLNRVSHMPAVTAEGQPT